MSSYKNIFPPSWDEGGPLEVGSYQDGEDTVILTGTRMIDEAVVGLCPEIENLQNSERQQLSLLISSFLSTREALLAKIEELTNSDVTDYLDSAKSLAEKETHGLIGDLEVFLENRAEQLLEKLRGSDC